MHAVRDRTGLSAAEWAVVAVAIVIGCCDALWGAIKRERTT